MSTENRSKTIRERLKGKSHFRRPGSPATADTYNASITSVPSLSESSRSTKRYMLSPISKLPISATSVVHVPDGEQPESNQETSASISAGMQMTISSEASSSGYLEASEPAVEPVLTPPKSSLRKDLWQEALEMLSKEMLHEIKKMGVGEPQSVSHQIDDLVKIAKTKQEECEKKFWRFHVGDHEIIIRDYAVKIVSWLQKTEDIAIQFAPPQASLPWAAIKVVMQVRLSFLFCSRLQYIEESLLQEEY